MISWTLERWRRKHPGLVWAIVGIVLVGGTAALALFVLRDLARGQILRPAIGVLALAAVSLRLIVSFRPYRPHK